MIQIGKYRLGFAPLSVIAVMTVLCGCAVIAAIEQARPEFPVPLYRLILVNVGMALAVTLVYGIFVHFILWMIEYVRKKMMNGIKLFSAAVTLDGDKASVTFTSSTWEYLPAGARFEFKRSVTDN